MRISILILGVKGLSHPCCMPLLHKKLSVILFWLTFTQLQLIGWLTDWLVADLLTDLLTSLHTNLLTNWLADWFNYWLTDWLTVWLIDCLTYWLQYLPQIVETKPVFLEFFGKFLTFTLLTFVLTQMCPSPSPMFSHSYLVCVSSRWL